MWWRSIGGGRGASHDDHRRPAGIRVNMELAPEGGVTTQGELDSAGQIDACGTARPEAEAFWKEVVLLRRAVSQHETAADEGHELLTREHEVVEKIAREFNHLSRCPR